MKVEVSNGELVDKVSILMIKSEKIKDQNKIRNIQKELQAILPNFDKVISVNDKLFISLKLVNQKLWDVEDSIRIKESEKTFDQEFIDLARQVYILNDERSVLKKEINKKTNSVLFEEKSYEKY